MVYYAAKVVTDYVVCAWDSLRRCGILYEAVVQQGFFQSVSHFSKEGRDYYPFPPQMGKNDNGIIYSFHQGIRRLASREGMFR